MCWTTTPPLQVGVVLFGSFYVFCLLSQGRWSHFSSDLQSSHCPSIPCFPSWHCQVISLSPWWSQTVDDSANSSTFETWPCTRNLAWPCDQLVRPREGDELPGLVQFPRWGSLLLKATAELTVHNG